MNENLYRYLGERVQHRQPRRFHQPTLSEAGVLIAVTDELDPKVLLTRRSLSLSSHKGEVAFPGGKKDAEDNDIIYTALREACEEVALPPEEVNIVGELDQVVSLHGYIVTPVLGVIEPDRRFIANPDELDAIFQVPLSHFTKPPSRYFEHGSARIPSYDYDEFHIWGITAMMIVEMMNICWDCDIIYKI